MYKAIILDLDDTLYDYKRINKQALHHLTEYTCKRYHIAPKRFEEVLTQAKMDTKSLLGNTGSSHNRILYFQKALEYLGEKPIEGALDMYEVYWSYMLEHMVLRSGAKEMLQYCQEKNIRIGICSDLTAHIQHRKLRHLGIGSYIDAIVTSEEAGCDKPAPVMFQLILNKLSVKADEALFIGDDFGKDVAGACSAGMTGVWLRLKKDEHHKTISSLGELRGIIDGNK